MALRPRTHSTTVVSEPVQGSWAALLYGCVLAVCTSAPALALGDEAHEPGRAGAPGQPGLAIRCEKALVAAYDGVQAVDHALVLVQDGKILQVGPSKELQVPEGFELMDVGEHWVCPGLIDLHCHIAGSMDINDMVYQVNSGLRVSASVVPDNNRLRLAKAAGVTTVLYIPGSGTNIGGQGILLKTGFDRFLPMRVRDPGSLKIAQGDNPTRWGYGMRRGLMNFHIRGTLQAGLEYAQAWAAWEEGKAEKPRRNISLDVFRDLYEQKTQISTHTQYYQLVMMSILMLAGEFPYQMYIDHGSFDSYLTGSLANEHGVAAILGPRSVMWPRAPRFPTEGRCIGSAWGFQQQGVERIGFNTDAPVVPQEELFLQAAMGVRYGLDDSRMQGVRGLTIVPAQVAGIDHRVGSLEPGKDADLLITTGDIVDPRTSVAMTYIEGQLVYRAAEGRKF